MVLSGVEHAEDHDARADHLIKHFVRKSAENDPAEISKVQTRAFGILGQLMQGVGDLVKEGDTQPDPALFIPVASGGQISLGGRADQQQPVHGGGRRNRASTSDQAVTAPGLVS